MSDELKKALDTAMARIASLEADSARRASVSAPQGIDPRALINDPVGTLTRAGLPLDHISKVMVAHVMGDQATPEMRMYSAMGPQVSATQALASDVQAMRQRFEKLDERDRKEAVRSSFTALSADKVKYPLLAAAMVKNPKLFDSDVGSHQGDASALAENLEGRLKATAEAVGYIPPASNANADGAQGQSTQTKQAQGSVDTTPPPLPQPKQGVFTHETHEQLKEKILRKYS